MDETKWLIAREIPRLRRYARALVGDPVEADDLVQDCLERAIRKRHLWTRRGSLRNWLYRMLYNLFVNQSAKRNRDRRRLPLDDAGAGLARPAAQEERVMFREVVSAMRGLSDEHRAAIVLTAVEGLPYDEAADVLGIPVGTLRSRLSRGRERLRALYVAPTGKATLRRVK